MLRFSTLFAPLFLINTVQRTRVKIGLISGFNKGFWFMRIRRSKYINEIFLVPYHYTYFLSSFLSYWMLSILQYFVDSSVEYPPNKCLRLKHMKSSFKISWVAKKDHNHLFFQWLQYFLKTSAVFNNRYYIPLYFFQGNMI